LCRSSNQRFTLMLFTELVGIDAGPNGKNPTIYVDSSEAGIFRCAIRPPIQKEIHLQRCCSPKVKMVSRG
jgi:hypothetical protein